MTLVTLTPLPEQRRAIEAPLGPVLVVAGPGAGKTYCLIARIEHVIGKGIDPHRICAVTFTNRAAEEIAARLKQTFASERARPITPAPFPPSPPPLPPAHAHLLV